VLVGVGGAVQLLAGFTDDSAALAEDLAGDRQRTLPRSCHATGAQRHDATGACRFLSAGAIMASQTSWLPRCCASKPL
jgi:hypothetical protein